MEAARTSETSKNSHQSKRCYNPEDSHNLISLPLRSDKVQVWPSEMRRAATPSACQDLKQHKN
jgi:hypothetical protein